MAAEGLSAADLVPGWWTWVLGAPVAGNPVTDPTGARAGLGQPEGPVWLVAGVMSGSVQREWTMPAGRRLFLPVLCLMTVPWLFFGRSPKLEVVDASATLNGDLLGMTHVLLRKLPVTAVAGNPFIEAQEQQDVRISTVGLWALTAPLRAGSHELVFGGTWSDGEELRVNCRIEAREER